MTDLSDAVILMAGSGSRLRVHNKDFLKPLRLVNGRPLISYTIDALVRSGIRRITAVLGFESEAVGSAVARLVPPQVQLQLVENRQWTRQNGISLLAAAEAVATPFLLTMSDHIFDARVIDLIRESASRTELSVAIDRKIETIFDLADATKIRTAGDGIAAIGKDLEHFDAIDTGLFVCPPEIFSYLERARQNDDCSLTDGVRLMADDGKVRCIDIGNAWWQDVDTAAMLRHAEKMLGGIDAIAAAP